MAFQLQITVDTIEDAERILACLRHDAAPAAAQVAEQVTAGKRGPGRPRKTTAEPVASASASESAAPAASDAAKAKAPDTGTADATANPAQQTPTFEDAKAALQKLLQKYDGDMTKPLAVLAKYKAQRISAVNEADWKAFIADCEAA